MRKIRCGEVWGGIEDREADFATPGLTASLYSRACEGGKGGDIYYLSVCNGELLTRFAVADVQGHGPAAARVSGGLYESMRDLMDNPAGDRLLADLNRAALGGGESAITTSAVAGFYVRDGGLSFTYAGHPPLLVRRNGEWAEATVPDPGGAVNLPLGIDAGVGYVQSSLPLAPGDALLVYTDGVIEAPDRDGRLWGVAGLRQALAAAAGGTPAEIRAAVLEGLHAHVGGTPSHDDVTLLVAQVA